MKVRISIIAVLFVVCGVAQESVDFSRALKTKVFKQAAFFPGRCEFGEALIRTDQAAGSNFYVCGSVNDWNQISGSGTGGFLQCATQAIASTALTAAATSMDIPLSGGLLPAKSTVMGTYLSEETQTACTGGCSGISAMKYSIGVTGNSTAFSPLVSLFVAPSDSTGYSSYVLFTQVSKLAQQLVAHFEVSNTSPGNLGNGSSTNLTAGSYQFSWCYATRP